MAKLITDLSGVTVPVHIPGLGDFQLPNPGEMDWDNLFTNLKRVISLYTGPIDFNELWNRFIEEIPVDQRLRFQDTLRNFVENIVSRHNRRKDMRWLPLLRNALRVETLRGQCDYVVGNPPWVRVHNIEPGLRRRLFENYSFYREAGWRRGADLGGSRGFGRQADYSMAFVERGLDLLRDGGTLAFVITSKIQQALYANVLRSHLIRETRVKRLIDYSLYGKPLFNDAVNYPLIICVDKGVSDNRITRVTIYNSGGEHLDFDTPQENLSLLTEDLQSPWVLVPPTTRAAMRTMQRLAVPLGQSHNRQPRMGVKTSLNHVFIVNSITSTEALGELLVTTEGGEITRIEDEMLRPVLRGENIREWRFEVAQWIIWTHDDTSGDALPELPPLANSYFENNRQTRRLKHRSDWNTGMPVWTIFRVDDTKLVDKVAWRRLSKKMEALYLPKDYRDRALGVRRLIPIQTVYLIPTPRRKNAYILSALLNSLPIRSYIMSFAEKASGSFFEYVGWIVGLVPLPPYLAEVLEGRLITIGHRERDLINRLVRISRQLHRNPNLPHLEEQLSKVVARLYDLNDSEYNALEEYFNFVYVSAEVEPTLEEDTDE